MNRDYLHGADTHVLSIDPAESGWNAAGVACSGASAAVVGKNYQTSDVRTGSPRTGSPRAIYQRVGVWETRDVVKPGGPVPLTVGLKLKTKCGLDARIVDDAYNGSLLVVVTHADTTHSCAVFSTDGSGKSRRFDLDIPRTPDVTERVYKFWPEVQA